MCHIGILQCKTVALHLQSAYFSAAIADEVVVGLCTSHTPYRRVKCVRSQGASWKDGWVGNFDVGIFPGRHLLTFGPFRLMW